MCALCNYILAQQAQVVLTYRVVVDLGPARLERLVSTNYVQRIPDLRQKKNDIKCEELFLF